MIDVGAHVNDIAIGDIVVTVQVPGQQYEDDLYILPDHEVLYVEI